MSTYIRSSDRSRARRVAKYSGDVLHVEGTGVRACVVCGVRQAGAGRSVCRQMLALARGKSDAEVKVVNAVCDGLIVDDLTDLRAVKL